MGLLEKVEAAYLKSGRPEMRPGDLVDQVADVVVGELVADDAPAAARGEQGRFVGGEDRY
jgi:hypothetical protein